MTAYCNIYIHLHIQIQIRTVIAQFVQNCDVGFVL